MSEHKKPLSYDEAGVRIDAGDEFADYIAALKSPAVAPGIGGFAAQVPLDLSAYSDPVLLTSTDGVGTKLMIAQEFGDWSTVGIDLVAMCVNDLVACGAEPVQFLDYIASGALNKEVLQAVIAGIVRGCEIAGCTLGGGETAEMPDMYGPNEIDLAGFVVGVVERNKMLPRKEAMRSGDILYGIASSGIHSNGLSLARKIIPTDEPQLRQLLLEPTRIYVREVLELCRTETILGAAHITGGGLIGNISRVLPPHLDIELTWDWKIPQIFETLVEYGVPAEEMRKVFNMGIGFVVVVPESAQDSFEHASKRTGIDSFPIGSLVGRSTNG